MDRNQNQSPDKQGQGRTSNISQDQNKEQQSQRDISDLDRQEGEMNNGELGGDLKRKAEGELDTDE